MLRLTVPQIIEKINLKETFEAVSIDYSFTIKIEQYVPFICGAVHDGHQFRKELWNNCLHSEYDRWFEEDPNTKQMVQTMPIVIAGMDSRFEYDLNRDPKNAVYTDAWGKQLWKTPISNEMKAKSLEKHTNFYKVVNALVKQIETNFGTCVVYDIHSYNWKRWDREVPTFNLGTSNINTKYKEEIESWRKMLSTIKLPNNIKSTSLINDTFQGNGYFLKYITQQFNNTLVLATEVKKIYCDELEQITFPEVVKALEDAFKTLIKQHANQFYQKYSK